MSKIILNMPKFSQAATIVVAVSTGVDSMVLLSLLEHTKNKLVVVHVNHQKRDESIVEENFIINYCSSRNIPCEVLHLTQADGNFQEDARNQRYAFFKAVADMYNTKLIATAHHLDDTIENVVARLVKGSYFKSLTNISDLDLDAYTILRPLSGVTKNEILSFASANNISYYEDESNKSNNYQRNRIRNKVIPLLRKENPSLERAFYSFTSEITEVNDFYDSLVSDFLIDGKIILARFKQTHISVQRYALYQLLGSLATRGLVNEIIKSIDHSSENKIFELATHQIVIEYGEMFTTKKDNTHLMTTLFINDYGSYNYSNYHIKISENLGNKDNNLCYNKKELPNLHIITPVDGMKISGSKTVKRLLVELKVPKAKRMTMPIGVDNMGNVLFVGNLWKNNNITINYLIEITEEY